MFNENLELAQEFPELKEQIHQLKMRDARFAKLYDEYHEISRQIHRAEQEIDTLSDTAMESLKKTRLSLKDQLTGLLKKAA